MPSSFMTHLLFRDPMKSWRPIRAKKLTMNVDRMKTLASLFTDWARLPTVVLKPEKKKGQDGCVKKKRRKKLL